jgi:endonuclease/exonuclease/phosphatase (EEP) superfamily protein YafD
VPRIRRLVAFLALAYPLTLVVVILVLRFASQRFWQIELALYVPRVLFGLPLPVLTILLFWLGMRRLLWTQAVAAWLVLFPLMGLVLPGWTRQARDPSETLRLLTYNGNFAYGGHEALAAQVLAVHPDIVIFQQLFFSQQLAKRLASSYAAMRNDGEFFIASRFPIRSAEFGGRLTYLGRDRSPRFIRYEVDSALGPLVIYSVHPISPLFQIAQARRNGLRQAIASGALFSFDPNSEINYDTGLRALQIQTFSEMAQRETLPVIVAGDTNSPGLSASLSVLKGFTDGFTAAGQGFGYTFPSNRPWMRIDRIFASRQLHFLDFGVGNSLASDHLPAFALMERTPPS